MCFRQRKENIVLNRYSKAVDLHSRLVKLDANLDQMKATIIVTFKIVKLRIMCEAGHFAKRFPGKVVSGCFAPNKLFTLICF
jgi:hypothetical protein